LCVLYAKLGVYSHTRACLVWRTDTAELQAATCKGRRIRAHEPANAFQNESYRCSLRLPTIKYTYPVRAFLAPHPGSGPPSPTAGSWARPRGTAPARTRRSPVLAALVSRIDHDSVSLRCDVCRLKSIGIRIAPDTSSPPGRIRRRPAICENTWSLSPQEVARRQNPDLNLTKRQFRPPRT
jgi:hypothetical protein